PPPHSSARRGRTTPGFGTCTGRSGARGGVRATARARSGSATPPVATVTPTSLLGDSRYEEPALLGISFGRTSCVERPSVRSRFTTRHGVTGSVEGFRSWTFATEPGGISNSGPPNLNRISIANKERHFQTQIAISELFCHT